MSYCVIWLLGVGVEVDIGGVLVVCLIGVVFGVLCLVLASSGMLLSRCVILLSLIVRVDMLMMFSVLMCFRLCVIVWWMFLKCGCLYCMRWLFVCFSVAINGFVLFVIIVC